MIEHLHDYIVEELKTNTKTDTIFVITSVILNLILLAINSSIATGNKEDILVMLIFVILIIVIALVSEIGLIKGKQSRRKLITGLLEIYKDNKIDKYYDKSLIENHKVRYNLFMITILATSLVSILVPFLALRN